MSAMNKQKLSLDSHYMNKVPSTLQQRHKHGSLRVEQNRHIKAKSDKMLGIANNEENDNDRLKDRKLADYDNNELYDLGISNFTSDSNNTTKTAMATNSGLTASILSSDIDSTTFFDTEEDGDDDDDGQ
jgi:hypothetical protein